MAEPKTDPQPTVTLVENQATGTGSQEASSETVAPVAVDTLVAPSGFLLADPMGTTQASDLYKSAKSSTFGMMVTKGTETKLIFSLDGSKPLSEGVDYTETVGGASAQNYSQVLKMIYNGYRTDVEGKLAPITDQEQYDAIQDAIYHAQNSAFTSTLSGNSKYLYDFLIGENLDSNPLKGMALLDSPKGEALNLYKTTNANQPSLIGVDFIKPTSIKVQKVWKDVNGKEITSPVNVSSVQVRLFANGIPVEDPIGLSVNNNWEASFDNLTKYGPDGQEIKYTVQEDNITNFTLEKIEQTADGFVITNKESLASDKVDVLFAKVNSEIKLLPQAKLEVLDQAGKLVHSWTSGYSVEKLSLDPGKYTMREVAAPTGYTKASDINFEVTVAKEVLVNNRPVSNNTVIMVNEEVNGYNLKIARVDEMGRFLPGAKLQILYKGQVIGEWTSGTDVTGAKLPTGDYILREVTAPTGYQKAQDLPFTIDANGQLLVNGRPVDNKTLYVVTPMGTGQAKPALPTNTTTKPGQPNPGNTTNQTKPGVPNSRVQLIKQDAATKAPLAGADFSLYSKDGAAPAAKDAGSKMSNAQLTSQSTVDTLAVKLMKDGTELKAFDINKIETKLDFGDNARGQYYLQIEALEGKVIQVNLENGGFMVSVTDLTDPKAAGTVENTAKLSFSDSNPGNLKGSYTTDREGKITIDTLAPGSYYFVETKAPVGYQGDFAKRYEFTVTENMTAPIVITALNSKIGALNNNANLGNKGGQGLLNKTAYDPKGGTGTVNSATKNPRTFVEGYGPHIAAMVVVGGGLIFADWRRRKSLKERSQALQNQNSDVE